MEPFSTIFLTLAHFKTGAGIKYQTESETILLYRHVQQKYFVIYFQESLLIKLVMDVCIYLGVI